MKVEKEKSAKTRLSKRKYYRKCGYCGARQEQSAMIRTAKSPNGWFCADCYVDRRSEEHPEYDEWGEY